MNEPTASANYTTVEEKIKAWFRKTRHRAGGRKRRYEMSGVTAVIGW
jgi:hypothetical protein